MNWLSILLALLGSLASSPNLHWAAVLSGLDHSRAAAFAEADPSKLARVYAPGSAAAGVDGAAIRAYARRDGRVVGAELTLLSCHVEQLSSRRVTLVVVDRLAAATVVWADGSGRRLPRDLPTRQVITLLRTPDGWRIE